MIVSYFMQTRYTKILKWFIAKMTMKHNDGIVKLLTPYLYETLLKILNR